MKTSTGNASEIFSCMDRCNIDYSSRFGGGLGDRPSLVEYSSMGTRLGRLLLVIPGQMHTFALDWKWFSFNIWGKHRGLGDRTHPVKWLHTLKYVWTKSSLENCRLARFFAGRRADAAPNEGVRASANVAGHRAAWLQGGIKWSRPGPSRQSS